MTREYGILFSAPMILATAAGDKTVTRRYSKRWTKLRPGDVLWTRETFAVYPAEGEYIEGWYREDMPERVLYRASDADLHDGKWKSPLHQPRWAARCLLEVVSVGPGPLDEMDEAEAHREGFKTLADFRALFAKLNPTPPPEPPTRIEWRLIQGETR